MYIKESRGLRVCDGFTADDYLLYPQVGRLPSRGEAVLHPFIFSAPMDCVTGYELAKAMLEAGEMPVVSRFISDDEYQLALNELGDNPNCWFAIGSDPEDVDKRLAWVASRQDSVNFAVDIAHGASPKGFNTMQRLSNDPLVAGVMSGSIASADGAKSCVQHGATHLRVGIGNGSACTTRLVTGVGVPQILALREVERALCDLGRRGEIAIIADGGIRNSGDAIKYLAAGADAIMMGGAFSRTREAAGWTEELVAPDWTQPQSFPVTPTYRLTKTYHGQASAEFQVKHKGTASAAPEGASSKVFEWDGVTTVRTVVEQYQSAARCAISYLGLTSLKELDAEHVVFIKVSAATLAMNGAHGT
jgi:IMP dehydrogenase